jgi:hypothetical protein
MPGFTFPPVGPVGLGSPPSRPFLLLGHRYYDPLRLPLLHLGSLRISLDSRYLACSRFRSSRLPGGGTHPAVPGRFCIPVCLPGARRKEMAVLSSSQATPVCTCPARRPRWCPLDSPYRLQDSQPSGGSKPSAFPSTCRVIPSDHNNKFFGAPSRGLCTRYTWLHTHPHGTCTQVRCRLGGSPPLVGLARCTALTHWVTSTSFTASLPIPRFWI